MPTPKEELEKILKEYEIDQISGKFTSQDVKEDFSKFKDLDLDWSKTLSKGPEAMLADLKRSIRDYNDEEENNTFAQPSSVGLAVLQRAKQDLNNGVYEDLGKNDGKRIREYFKTFNSPARQEWCAAAISTWMKEGGVSFISGSLGALMVGQQFRNAKKWVERDNIKPQHLAPGNVAVWRSPKRGAGAGHIGVISSSNGYDFTSIEGNSGPKGDRVYENSHSAKDSNLVGIGILSDTFVKASANNRIVKIANKLIYKYDL